MFTRKERELLKIGRAVINLHGFFLVTENHDIVDNPVIMVDLLTKIELESFKALLTDAARNRQEVEESVVYEKLIMIVGTPQKIHVGLSPAGVITTIAEAIIKKSEWYVVNPDNSAYLDSKASVNYIEVMCNIISYYMTIPYDEVINLPVNEIYKRYAIVQQTFPSQVQELEVSNKPKQ